MKYSIACVLAAVAAGVNAQGAPAGLAPSGSPPAGAISSGTGSYEVTITKPGPATRRSLEKRATCDCNALIVQLNGGVLTDSKGRIGSIVANRQFQFDGPPAQTGAIYDAGFSILPNTSIAIGSTTNFYQCLSGSFYNLYDQAVGANCSLVNLNAASCSVNSACAMASSSGVGSSMTATGSVMPTSTATQVVSQTSDGQPQASSAAPVPTGAAAQFVASGAVVGLGAMAALFL